MGPMGPMGHGGGGIGCGLGFGRESAGLTHGVDVVAGEIETDAKVPPTLGLEVGCWVIRVPSLIPPTSDPPWGSRSGAFPHEASLWKGPRVSCVTPGYGEAEMGKAPRALREAPPPYGPFGGKRVTGRHPSLFVSLTHLQNFLGCGKRHVMVGRMTSLVVLS